MREYRSEEREIIVECGARMKEIAGASVEGLTRWEAAEVAEAKAYGPRYSPKWFTAEGERMPEKFRVRYLRAVGRLWDEGIVELTSEANGRMAHVKLTAAGWAAFKDAARRKPASSPAVELPPDESPPDEAETPAEAVVAE